jgi:ribosomal protein L27
VTVGLGMKGATGQGGAATLRLAHVANARTVVAVEVSGSALFTSVAGSLYRTDEQTFLLAGQLYLNPALWVRGAVGFGRYGGGELRMGDLIMRERFQVSGPAGSVGAGLDLIRLHHFRGGVEFASTAMINSDGVLSSNAFLIGLTID